MEPQALLTVNRLTYTDETTIGELLINGIFQCHTLEDSCRRDKNDDGFLQEGEKVFEKTAIPSGRYAMRLDVSGRFGFCPFVLDVPYFKEIRFHWGNAAVDTRGCILVGAIDPKLKDFIIGSKVAFANLMRKLIPLEPSGFVLDVRGGLPADLLKI